MLNKNFDLNNYDAYIFDFDGTLVDSLDLWHAIDIKYLSQFGITVPEDLGDAINGMSFTETAKYFKERFDLPYDIEHIKQDWINMSHNYYMNNIQFVPGAKEFIKFLGDNDKKIGIATSNQAYTTENFFKSRNIDNINAFSYSCDVPKGKPAPFVFLRAADKLSVSPENCLAFEDTYEGVKAAKSAGMTVIALEEEHSKAHFDKIKELADYTIKDYTELLDGSKL